MYPNIVVPSSGGSSSAAGTIKRCQVNGVGSATILSSSGVASVVRNSAGNYTITWEVPYSDAYYSYALSRAGSDGNRFAIEVITVTAAAITLVTKFTDVAADSSNFSVMCIGD